MPTNHNNNARIKFRLKVVKRSGEVLSIVTTKKRRFLLRLQAVPCSEGAKYKLSVIYGFITNVHGERVIAKNEGEYSTLTDLLFAFRIFSDPKEVVAITSA